jgi:phosphomannomutase
MNPEKQPELQDKIVAGLEVAYARMLEFKRKKNSEVVVMRDGKIVRIKP